MYYCKLMVFEPITSRLFPVFIAHTHLGLLGGVIMHLHHDSLNSSCIVYMCWQSYHPHIGFVNQTLIPIQNLLKCISPQGNESPNRDLITVSSGEDRKWDRKSNFFLFLFWGYCYQNKSFVRAWKEVEALKLIWNAIIWVLSQAYSTPGQHVRRRGVVCVWVQYILFSLGVLWLENCKLTKIVKCIISGKH